MFIKAVELQKFKLDATAFLLSVIGPQSTFIHQLLNILVSLCLIMIVVLNSLNFFFLC